MLCRLDEEGNEEREDDKGWGHEEEIITDEAIQRETDRRDGKKVVVRRQELAM